MEAKLLARYFGNGTQDTSEESGQFW